MKKKILTFWILCIMTFLSACGQKESPETQTNLSKTDYDPLNDNSEKMIEENQDTENSDSDTQGDISTEEGTETNKKLSAEEQKRDRNLTSNEIIGNGYYSYDGTVYYFSELSDLVLHDDGYYYAPKSGTAVCFLENNRQGLFDFDYVDEATFYLYKKYVYEERDSIRIEGDTITITVYQHASDDIGSPVTILSQYLGLPDGDYASLYTTYYACRMYGTEDEDWNGYTTYVSDSFYLYGTSYTLSSFYEAKENGRLDEQRQFYLSTRSY